MLGSLERESRLLENRVAASPASSMEQKKQRSSNFELMRIIVMLAIVAHHYVVNSSVGGLYTISGHPSGTIFLQFFGMFGKAGINAFVLISGYFMCCSQLTISRCLKVIVPILLYRTLCLVVGCVFDLCDFSWAGAFNIVIGLFRNAGANGSFVASFPVFYLMVPALNKIVRALDREGLELFLLSSLSIIVGIGTIFGNESLFNEVVWFCNLYCVAAWIRLYPHPWTNSLQISVLMLSCSILLNCAFILISDFFVPSISAYYLVHNPSRLAAFCIGLFTFLPFKNLHVRQMPAINRVASHTFGVLLFHANWIGWRALWLQGGLFDVAKSFTYPTPILALRASFAVLAVFCMGAAFDYLVATPIENVIYKLCNRSKRRAAFT